MLTREEELRHWRHIHLQELADEWQRAREAMEYYYGPQERFPTWQNTLTKRLISSVLR